MILIDPRGGKHGKDTPLEISSHIPSKFRVEFMHMDSGDFAWIGHGPDGLVDVGVELKHVSDLLQSMQDGRLPEQLRQMRGDYDYRFLLIQDRIQSDAHGYLQVWTPKEPGPRRYSQPGYGDPRKGYWRDATIGARSRIFWGDYWKWVTSLNVMGGFRLLMAGSNQEVGRLIGAEYEWWRKQWNEHKSLQMFDDSSDTPLFDPSIPAQVIHKLVWNTGPQRAMNAAAYFGTVFNAINATEQEWRAAFDDGKDQRVLAKRALRAIHTQHVARTISGKRGDERARRKRES